MSQRRRTKSEQVLIQHLQSQMGPADRLLAGLRISDPKSGDVEIDLVLLLAGVGIAVIEVKGGEVSFQDGQWWVHNPRQSRRVNPVEQARRAKYALRGYLDRQPQWAGRSAQIQWFVAMPFTDVNGDLGPEGLRELMIGRNDLKNALTQIRSQFQPLAAQTPDLEMAHRLINGLVETPPGERHLVRRHPIVAAASAALLLGGGAFIWTGTHPASGTTNCDSNYSGCVPVSADVDCSDLQVQVTVLGEDVYGLDRDKDGKACEWNQK